MRGGRIAAVGSDEDVAAAAGAHVPRRDLGGAVVTPGLVDTHPHLMHFAAFFGAVVDITGARNHADIVALIREAAAHTPKGGWIVTSPVGEPHYFLRRSWRDLEEGVLPDRRVLDAATTDHPVYIQAWAPVLPNTSAANSAALGVLGIDRNTPDQISGVYIEKDDAGEPTGRLSGAVTTYYNVDPYYLELASRMPDLIQPDKIPAAFAAMSARYNAMGITTIFEAHDMDIAEIEAYKALRQQGLLSLRTIVSHSVEVNALPANKPKSMEQIAATLQRALEDRSVADDWLRIDGITTNAFGPLGCGRMWWQDGYVNYDGSPTTGDRQISEEKMMRAIDFCAEQGLRLNLLCCSPDESDQYIEWVSDVIATKGLDKVDWLIEHGYVMRPDQPAKFAQLGFDITVCPGFTFGKGELIEERFGRDALAWLNPLRRFLDSGMTVAASNDWGPTNPFEQMQLAVTHEMQPSRRRNDGPDQVVTREEAFAMWTTAAPTVLRWDGIGTLTEGSYADLAILDRDPIASNLDDLHETRVEATMVDGGSSTTPQERSADRQASGRPHSYGAFRHGVGAPRKRGSAAQQGGRTRDDRCDRADEAEDHDDVPPCGL